MTNEQDVRMLPPLPTRARNPWNILRVQFLPVFLRHASVKSADWIREASHIQVIFGERWVEVRGPGLSGFHLRHHCGKLQPASASAGLKCQITNKFSMISQKALTELFGLL